MSPFRLAPRQGAFALFILFGSLIFNTSVVWATEPHVAHNDLQNFLWTISSTHFVDATGHEVRSDDLHDKVVAIGFFNTRCSAPCALRMLDLAKVVKALPAAARDRVVVLALSGDPEHDTTDDLGKFAAGMGIAPRSVTFLTADKPAMRQLYSSIQWRQPAVEPDDVPPTIFVFDRLGQSAMRYDASPLDQPRLVRDLTALVSFSHGVGSPPDLASAAP